MADLFGEDKIKFIIGRIISTLTGGLRLEHNDSRVPVYIILYQIVLMLLLPIALFVILQVIEDPYASAGAMGGVCLVSVSIIQVIAYARRNGVKIDEFECCNLDTFLFITHPKHSISSLIWTLITALLFGAAWGYSLNTLTL